MTATVTELYAAGRTRVPGAYRTHRAWMQPGVPMTIGRHNVAEIQISTVGDRRVPRLVVKGRPRRRTIFPWHGRTVATIERGRWQHLDGHDLMFRPFAIRWGDLGRPSWVLIEFAALSAAAAKGWPE